MYISEQSQDVITELITESYKINKKMDRLVSVLGVKFAMNNTADLCHKGIAHYFPNLADEIGDKCLERYNVDIKYGEISEAKEDYYSPHEIIKKINEYVVEFQNMFMGCIMIVQQNQDIQCYVDLLDMLKDYNRIVEQTILMVDKIELYGDAMSSYDAHIKEHFWIL